MFSGDLGLLLHQQQHQPHHYHHFASHYTSYSDLYGGGVGGGGVGGQNNSLISELQLLQEHFHELGSQCLAVWRFTATWFFPLFFLVTQMLPYAAALNSERRRRNRHRQSNNVDGIEREEEDDDDESESAATQGSHAGKSLVDRVEEWLLLRAPRDFVRRMLASSSSSSSPSAAHQQQRPQQQAQQRHHAVSSSTQNPAATAPAPTAPRFATAPKHVAVIMDGNRRYGKQQLGSALRGHRAGGEKLREFVRWCRLAGVEMLTVYAFSTENWNRPQQEVDLLMDLFASFFEQMLLDAAEIGIRIRFMSSEAARLPPRIRDLMERVERETRRHAAAAHICVNVCASYGSRSAVIQAAAAMAANEPASSGSTANDGDAAAASEKAFMRALAVSHLERVEAAAARAPAAPTLFCERDAELWAAPDVLIRTSGEVRLSNFLLMEAAYAEMFFWNVTWPEVTQQMLHECFASFEQRQRRMGK